MFQAPLAALDPRMRIHDAIAEGMAAFGIGHNAAERTERVVSIMRRVGLDPDQMDRFPHEFSGGQRQRVCIARALGVEVPRAGMLLMVPLSGLFVLPLALYLYRVGFPLAGLLGGAIASLSPAFFPRSTIYRVDTDGGNLFFGWLVAACTAELRADASALRNAIAAAA